MRSIKVNKLPQLIALLCVLASYSLCYWVGYEAASQKEQLLQAEAKVESQNSLIEAVKSNLEASEKVSKTINDIVSRGEKLKGSIHEYVTEDQRARCAPDDRIVRMLNDIRSGLPNTPGETASADSPAGVSDVGKISYTELVEDSFRSSTQYEAVRAQCNALIDYARKHYVKPNP